MTPSEIAEKCLVYAALVGSRAHGLQLEGTDDRDEMGIALEPPAYVIGLRRFESYVSRTQPEGVRSGPSDLDRAIYSARKYAALAAQGNPSILGMLYAPTIHSTHLGQHFVTELKRHVASKAAGPRFLGYLVAQRMKLTGERGNRVKRPELIAEYGYDTKFAMHAVRLGIQGLEFLWHGRITLPMPERERIVTMRVRRGEADLVEVLQLIEHLEENLKRALATSPLPPRPEMDAIDQLLIDTYHLEWEALHWLR